VYFRLQRNIHATPAAVFVFLRDKEHSARLAGQTSRVLSLEKLSEGPARAGTRYRECVRMLPFVTACIDSELIRVEAYRCIEERWWGAGMLGILRYTLRARDGMTRLEQEQTLYCHSWLRLLSPVIYLAFWIAIQHRLTGIRRYLESDSG